MCVCWTLLLSAPRVAPETANGQAAEGTGAAPGCPVRFKAAGQCADGEECPYKITLPPLTIQLPKQFKMLEKTMKELQSLKETVNKLKSACQECRKQADRDLQKDSGEVVPLDQPARGDNHEGGDRGQELQSTSTQVKEMQTKMNRMSNSLKNAHNQINTMQGKLEELNLLNKDNVEAIVDNKVENITTVINNLNSKCSSACPVQTSPQCEYRPSPLDAGVITSTAPLCTPK